MVSRCLSVRLIPLASFALVAMMAVAGRAEDPFSLDLKSTRPLPAAKAKAPEVLPPVLPELKKEAFPTSPAELLDLTASIEPAHTGRGELVWLVVRGKTKPFAHTFSALKGKSLTRFKLVGADGIMPTTNIEESTPEEANDPDLGIQWLQHGSFWWKQQLLVTATAKPGPLSFDVEVQLQACTEKGGEWAETCILRPYAPLKVRLDISDAPPVTPPPDVKAQIPDGPGKIDVNDLQGLLVAAFVGAIVMLLTPCVFPMIPITVNYFIKQSEKEHHRPFFMAFVYAGSIILLLTVVILAAGNAVIQLAVDPWFNLGMGVVLVLFALGLFGLFEVDLTIFGGTVLFMIVGYLISMVLRMRVPAEWLGELPLALLSLALTVPLLLALNRIVHQIAARLGFEHWSLVGFLSRQESRGGVIGASFMAMTFTITSFSCTGPFLGILLAPIAKAQPPIGYLILAALVYATTFAAPFFLLALFPTWLKKLPRSGGWMTTIKVTMGFLELGAALKFLSNTDIAWFPGDPQLFNYDTVVCAWIALAAACALHLFGIFQLDHDDPTPAIGPVRMLFAAVFVGLAVYLSPLLFGIQPKGAVMDVLVSFLPVNFDLNRGQGGGGGGSGSEGFWIPDDYSAAWAVAKRENKLILIDFTGVNCAACRKNERNIFPNPEVTAEFKKFVCVKLYTDIVPNKKPAEAARQAKRQGKLQEQLGLGYTQPTYAIIDPDRTKDLDGDKIRGRLVDSRGGVLELSDFVKFLRSASSSGRNEGGANSKVARNSDGDVIADRGR